MQTYLTAFALTLGLVTGLLSLYQFIRNQKSPAILLALLAVVLLIGTIYFAELPSSTANNTPSNASGSTSDNIQTTTMIYTPVPTQPSISYPRLASAYHGNVQNTTAGGMATLNLTSITQNQQNLNGNVVIGAGLCGSGSFTGTIDTTGNINFTDTPTDACATIMFSGTMHSDGSLSGTYTLPSWNQQGTWEATSS